MWRWGEKVINFFMSHSTPFNERRVNKIKERTVLHAAWSTRRRSNFTIKRRKRPQKKLMKKCVQFFPFMKKVNELRWGKKASNKSENRFFPPPPQFSIKLHNYTLCLCSVCVWVGERKSEWKMLEKMLVRCCERETNREKSVGMRRAKKGKHRKHVLCVIGGFFKGTFGWAFVDWVLWSTLAGGFAGGMITDGDYRRQLLTSWLTELSSNKSFERDHVKRGINAWKHFLEQLRRQFFQETEISFCSILQCCSKVA